MYTFLAYIIFCFAVHFFLMSSLSLFSFAPFEYYFWKNWCNQVYLLGHVVCQNYQSFYLFNVFNIVREQSLSPDLKVLPLLFSFHSHSQAIAFGHRALNTIYMCPPHIKDSALTPDLYFRSRTRSFLHLDVSQASQSYTKATALILTPSLDPPHPSASLHQLPATPSFPVPRPQTLKSFSLLLPLPLPLPLPSLSPSSQLANAIVYCLQDPDISHPLTMLARPPIISLLDVSTAPICTPGFTPCFPTVS